MPLKFQLFDHQKCLTKIVIAEIKVCREQLSKVKALYCPSVVASLQRHGASHIFSTLHNKLALSALHCVSGEGNVCGKTPEYLIDLKSTT